jgi:hypothetical protein
MSTAELSIKVVGYQVRTADGERPVGEVEGVRPNGLRLHRIVGHPGHHGYLPARSLGRIDRATNTIFLRTGIDVEQIVDAPPPPGERPDGWRKSSDWWADLLGHYGLYESEGRGNEPFLHPAQR